MNIRKSFTDYRRLFMHIPCGIVGAFFIWINLTLGIVFNLTFLIYEVVQDWRTNDKSFHDIKGYCWGLGIGAIIWFVLGILGVL